jgi:DNA replication protein DnaC
MSTTLVNQLKAISLYYLADNLDDIIALTTRKRWSPTQLLEHIADLESKDRTRRSLERRLGRSQIGRFKPMTDFDWSWPKEIDRQKVESALHLDFMEQAGNVVLIANQGLGKTMIAKNIAYQAAIAGHAVRFVSASQLLLDLGAQDSAKSLDRRLRYWSSIKLLAIDEIGYLSYDSRNADLLFQVISRRYENKSLVLTTNLVFKEWPTIFPNAACTTAMIDRVIHHALIIPIQGDSYRKREAEIAAKSDSRSTRKKTSTT